MNRNLPLIAWLVALLLGLSALLNVFFVFQQLMVFKDLENLNAKNAEGPPLQNLTQNLLNDLVAYGQKQPAIHPLLQKYGINPPPPSKSP